MKRLGTVKTGEQNYYSSALRAITINLSSLLIWTRMLLNVGFVVIAAAIIATLYAGMALIYTYKDGTRPQVEQILPILIFCLIIKLGVIISRKSTYRKNS